MVFSNNLLAGSGGQSTGYEIDQSIRFNKSASALMSRTFGTATDRNVFTYAFWMKACSESNGYTLETNTTGGVTFSGMVLNGGSMQFFDYSSGSANIDVRTAFINETKFRDYSAWYHAMFVYNSDESAAADRIKFFINGERYPSGDLVGPGGGSPVFPSSGANSYFNSSMVHRISSSVNGLVDGYMADIYFIDGQALDPTSFGEFSSTTGQFIPIEYEGTFGNNGFYIDGRDSSDLGDDESGNGNDFSTSNMGTDDQVNDSPTSNHCVLNALNKDTDCTLTDGNLQVGWTSGTDPIICGTMAVSSGKWYYEATFTGTFNFPAVGIAPAELSFGGSAFSSGNGALFYYAPSGNYRGNGDNVSYGAEYFVSSKIGVALNLDDNEITFYKDNSSQGTLNLASIRSGYSTWVPLVTGGGSVENIIVNFGQSAFATTSDLPSGFNTLKAANLPDPAIALPEKYFNPVLYEGNGAGQRVGQFQPLTELYSVPNSVIFNEGDTAYLNRTPGSASNRNTFTWSFWIKRGKLTSHDNIFSAGTNSNNFTFGAFINDKIQFGDWSGSYGWNLVSNQVFDDSSIWYNVVFRYDDTQSTESNRVRIYVNGSQLTSYGTESYPSQNYGNTEVNNTVEHTIGRQTAGSGVNDYFDGYMTEINLIDGQSLGPDSFGQLDASTNKWIPKDTSGLTFGTNGFYLDMEIAPGTGNGAGNDVSGNNNDFNENNLAATDQVTDSPTKNFVTFDPSRIASYATLSEGNLSAFGNTATNNGGAKTNLTLPNSGKFYLETTFTSGSSYPRIGASVTTKPVVNAGNGPGDGVNGFGFSYDQDGKARVNGTSISSFGSAVSTGQIVQLFFDMDNGAVYVGINNTLQNSGDPSSGSAKTGAMATWHPGTHELVIEANVYNTSSGVAINAGQRSFSYTPPSGYSAINNDNFPLSNGELSGFVWIKNRDAADNHMLFDAVRGIKKDLHSNSTAVEATNANTLTRFLKNGFEISNDNEVNTSGESYVAWQWLQDSLTASSNTDGSITSSVLSSTTSGFSIVSYSGNATSGATVGHGLGADLKMIILKDRGVAENWCIFHEELGPTKFVYFTTDAPFTASNRWNDTSPTSSVFTLGNETQVNGSSRNYIAYCFAEVEGFSKISSYVGNGSTNGPFVHTGFRPAWVILKRTNATQEWQLYDDKRSPFNPVTKRLQPNATNAEDDLSPGDNELDFLSNGFKLIEDNGGMNASGATYIYMAFAEQPFKTANAR